jgi:CDP-glucose 4,6-dehydratase
LQRDYFYVRDAVEAYLALAERVPEPGFAGEAFNFGTETPLSVVDMASRILDVMGRGSLELTIMNQASNEIPRQYLDCAKARRRMEWRPKWSMDESLRETVAWYGDWLSRTGGARDAAAVNGSAS